jgi:hypothetical protein
MKGRGSKVRVERAALARLEASAWTHPVGTPVDVRRDGGEIVRTKTRSEAAVIGETAVIWLDGISGCYALERVALVRP